ncbi:hypothetical protein CIRG_09889 [Coccidioides immitis RMSCC 2394]|uniref:Uncharacterized protein n=1 Tax=Coccidioides immitis RMSCC 2394 TaxID=404692 RepID=A0A0J6YT96_COCIT|nr:hypothetical protein CIRG_09889 [Coccidioides immitis RMSCC 2394]
MRPFNKTDVEWALHILTHAPDVILKETRGTIIATIVKLRRKLKDDVDGVNSLLDSFRAKSTAVKNLGEKDLNTIIDFTLQEADIRFSHTKANQPNDNTPQSIARSLCAHRSLGFEYDNYLKQRYQYSKVHKLASDCSKTDGQKDDHTLEFLRSNSYGTGWPERKAVNLGIKLLVFEKIFGDPGISTFAMHSLSKFRDIQYRLLPIIVGLMREENAYADLGRIATEYGQIIHNTQKLYNRKADEIRHALGLVAIPFTIQNDDGNSAQNGPIPTSITQPSQAAAGPISFSSQPNNGTLSPGNRIEGVDNDEETSMINSDEADGYHEPCVSAPSGVEASGSASSEMSSVEMVGTVLGVVDTLEPADGHSCEPVDVPQARRPPINILNVFQPTSRGPVRSSSDEGLQALAAVAMQEEPGSSSGHHRQSNAQINQFNIVPCPRMEIQQVEQTSDGLTAERDADNDDIQRSNASIHAYMPIQPLNFQAQSRTLSSISWGQDSTTAGQSLGYEPATQRAQEELATAEVLTSLPSYTHRSVNEGNSTVPAMGHGTMGLLGPTPPEINPTAPRSPHNPSSYIPTPTAAESVQEIGSDGLQGTAPGVISRFEQAAAMQQSSSPGFATVIPHSPNDRESPTAPTNPAEHVSNNASKRRYTENNAHENLKRRRQLRRDCQASVQTNPAPVTTSNHQNPFITGISPSSPPDFAMASNENHLDPNPDSYPISVDMDEYSTLFSIDTDGFSMLSYIDMDQYSMLQGADNNPPMWSFLDDEFGVLGNAECAFDSFGIRSGYKYDNNRRLP